jgi:hypothetical protein
MNPQRLPAQLDPDAPAWMQTIQAFLGEKHRRSGSQRTVEGYSRMLWPFLNSVGSPDHVTAAHVLGWAHDARLQGTALPGGRDRGGDPRHDRRGGPS